MIKIVLLLLKKMKIVVTTRCTVRDMKPGFMNRPNRAWMDPFRQAEQDALDDEDEVSLSSLSLSHTNTHTPTPSLFLSDGARERGSLLLSGSQEG